jgi:hypothetical protein
LEPKAPSIFGLPKGGFHSDADDPIEINIHPSIGIDIERLFLWTPLNFAIQAPIAEN